MKLGKTWGLPNHNHDRMRSMLPMTYQITNPNLRKNIQIKTPEPHITCLNDLRNHLGKKFSAKDQNQE